MPWEKQFDREDVLDKAMHAFWRHGYSGTSMKDLIGCMGLNPGSIYATFGDKKSLFRHALEHYKHQTHELLADFERTYPPRQAILELFKKMVEDVRTGPQNGACFIVNTVVETTPKDEKIDCAAQAGLAEFDAFIGKMIKAGQDRGEINPTLNVEKTSRILMGLIVGGRVLARGHLDDKALQDFIDHADHIIS